MNSARNFRCHRARRKIACRPSQLAVHLSSTSMRVKSGRELGDGDWGREPQALEKRKRTSYPKPLDHLDRTMRGRFQNGTSDLARGHVIWKEDSVFAQWQPVNRAQKSESISLPGDAIFYSLSE